MEKELLSLIKFLAKGLTDLEHEVLIATSKDDRECKDYLFFKTSRIQGMQAQLKLTKIGKMEHDLRDVGNAIDYILEKIDNGNP